jgi:hypothetical protein
MADVLLSLTMRNDVAQLVEDLLLSRPDLARGFTASLAEGHGAVIPLVEPSELVSGHSPRTQIRLVGPEDRMRAVLDLIKAKLPGTNIFFWLIPVIDMGRL